MSRFSILSLALLSIGLICADAANVNAQGRRGGGGGMGNMMNGRISMLGNEDICEKLEIVPEQKEQIEELEGEMRDMFRESFSGMREKFGQMNQEEREGMMTEIREGIEEKMKGIDTKVDEILMPFQIERLDQIVLQSKIDRGGGLSGLLGDKAFLEKANLSEADIEALKKKAEEVREWLAEENKRIKSEAQEKLLSVLTSEQREAIEEMIGEPHEFQRQQRGGFGGRRGGQRGGGENRQRNRD